MRNHSGDGVGKRGASSLGMTASTETTTLGSHITFKSQEEAMFAAPVVTYDALDAVMMSRDADGQCVYMQCGPRVAARLHTFATIIADDVSDCGWFFRYSGVRLGKRWCLAVPKPETVRSARSAMAGLDVVAKRVAECNQ